MEGEGNKLKVPTVGHTTESKISKKTLIVFGRQARLQVSTNLGCIQSARISSTSLYFHRHRKEEKHHPDLKQEELGNKLFSKSIIQ